MEPLQQVLIKHHPLDTVAITLLDLFPGSVVSLEGHNFHIHESIPSGHKIAVKNIFKGDPIIRYGWTIGTALSDIQTGDWVHSHNLGISDFSRDFLASSASSLQSTLPAVDNLLFNGFVRPDGRVGTRNWIAIISTVNCVNPVVRAIQNHFTAEKLLSYPNLDGVIAITHDSGCSLPTDGFDHANLRQILTNIAHHPNIAACLFIALGCEVNQMAEALAPFDIPILAVQDEGGSRLTIQKGIKLIEGQLEYANAFQRSPQSVSKLNIAPPSTICGIINRGIRI